MSIIKQLAKILEKAHGRTCAESNKEIDVGLEVTRIREESDRMNQRIRELESALSAKLPERLSRDQAEPICSLLYESQVECLGDCECNPKVQEAWAVLRERLSNEN